MTLVALIPMAGESKRFTDAGYTVPKPFLPMADRRMMFEHVIDSFPIETKEVITINLKEHGSLVSDGLGNSVRDGKGLWVWRPSFIAGHKTIGPLDTILHARHNLWRDVELIINYCDCFISREQMTMFVSAMREHKRHAGVVCFPSNNPRFQYEPSGKFAMSGIFWFKSAKQFARMAVAYRDDPNMSPGHIAYSLRWMGLPMCKTWVTDDYVDLGVPESYELYKAMTTAKVIEAKQDA